MVKKKYSTPEVEIEKYTIASQIMTQSSLDDGNNWGDLGDGDDF